MRFHDASSHGTISETTIARSGQLRLTRRSAEVDLQGPVGDQLDVVEADQPSVGGVPQRGPLTLTIGGSSPSVFQTTPPQPARTARWTALYSLVGRRREASQNGFGLWMPTKVLRLRGHLGTSGRWSPVKTANRAGAEGAEARRRCAAQPGRLAATPADAPGTPVLGAPQRPTRRCEASPGPDPGCAFCAQIGPFAGPRGRDSASSRASGYAAGRRLQVGAPAGGGAPQRAASIEWAAICRVRRPRP